MAEFFDDGAPDFSCQDIATQLREVTTVVKVDGFSDVEVDLGKIEKRDPVALQ